MLGHARVLERDVQEIDALIRWKQVTAQTGQHGAVQTTREQDGDSGFGRLAFGRRWHVQHAQLQRADKLATKFLDGRGGRLWWGRSIWRGHVEARNVEDL